MTDLDELNHANRVAKEVFCEVCEFTDRAVVEVVNHLPPLEERQRGGERLFRYPEKTVDVALALKLVQLRGNIQAGKKLVESGFFFEWDVIQRSMQDALEDVTFLVLMKDEKTKVNQRYIEFFFGEDIDKNGALSDRSKVRIERRDVRKVLAEAQRGLSGTREGIEKQSRRLSSLRSGSVHGRAASIIRAYLDESAEGGLWLAGSREPWRMAWERASMYIMAGWVVSAFHVAGVCRWWDEGFSQEAMILADQMKEAAENVVRSLKNVG